MDEYKFGTRSLQCLGSCEPDLADIAHIGMSYQIIDFGIIWGFRNKEEQNGLLEQIPPATTKAWPDSMHNKHIMQNGLLVPESQAFDFAVYVDGKIQWADTHAFAMVVGILHVAARQKGRRIRSGMDWDRDGRTTDQSFMDFGHIELVN